MYENIEFVICAAGECTRNYPHSRAIAHKSLLPMGDKRIIDYVLQDILKIGGRHITFVCSNQVAVDAFKKALSLDQTVVQKLRDKGQQETAEIVAQTILPTDVDLKFVIQKEPLGTAHVLYAARKAIQNRHVVLIFPDDILLSHDAKTPHMKRLLTAFLKNPKTALITAIWREDVSDNAILVNNRIIEKPTHTLTHISGWDPNVLPKEMIQFLIKRAPEKIKRVHETKKEWYYTDAINDFLDNGGEKAGFKVEMFLISDKDQMIDTGKLFEYEQALLTMLLQHSKYQKQNQQLAKKLLT